MNEQNIEIKQPQKSKKRLVKVLLLIVVLVVAGALYYKKYSNSTSGKEAKAKAETSKLIKQVSAHMTLPQDDQPAVFDITDPSQLAAQQAFFSGSQKGDKLIVFSKSAKAIIYSPSRDLIINVGPVTFDQNTFKAPTKQEVTAKETTAATASSTQKKQ